MKLNLSFHRFSQFYHELATLNRDNLGRASGAVQYSLMALVVLVIGIFGWLLLISPSLDKLSALKQNEANLIAQYHDSQDADAKLSTIRQAQLSQNNQLAAALARLPKSAPMTYITQTISQSGAQMGVSVVSSSVESMRREAHYTVRPMRVQAVGSYHALGRWLYQLTQGTAFLLTLHDYTLVSDGSADRLRLDIMMQTYQANPELISDAEADDKAAAPIVEQLP